MMRRGLACAAAVAVLVAAGCRAKRPQAPAAPVAAPAPKQNVFVLLQDEDGGSGAVVVSNSGGAQELNQANQSVRVEKADARPTDPILLSAADVERLFGPFREVRPKAEARFVLYFEEGKDELTRESEAQIAAILAAIRERKSTLVTVTGHTDTTSTPEFNYELGLKRAERVAGVLRGRGVSATDLMIRSHGQTDLLVKTDAGVSNRFNRRVEVIVR